jgi:hypothetical protein
VTSPPWGGRGRGARGEKKKKKTKEKGFGEGISSRFTVHCRGCQWGAWDSRTFPRISSSVRAMSMSMLGIY